MATAKPLNSVKPIKPAAEPSTTTPTRRRSNLVAKPFGLVYGWYVKGETRVAAKAESLVGSSAFGELLALSASNAMALARVVNTGADRGVRLVRVAGRADVTSLARQLARTEDKLERLLEMVEELADRADGTDRADGAGRSDDSPQRRSP